MANYQISGTGEVLFRFSTTEGVSTSGSGSASLSSDYSRDGDQVAKITTGTNANDTHEITVGIDLDFDSDDKAIRAFIYIPDTSQLTNIKVYLTSTTDLSKYAQATLAANILKDGWYQASARRSDFSLVNGESWANTMIKARIEAKTSGGGTTIYVSDLTFNYRARPKIIIGFDDGYSSARAAADIMADRNIPGSFMLNAADVGTTNYIDKGDVDAMYAAGHEIGNHSYDHIDLTTLSQDAVQAQIERELEVQLAYGYVRGSRTFSHPFASHNATTRAAAVAAGMDVIGCWTRPGGLPTAEGVDDVTQLGSHTLSSSLSLVTAKTYVDRAVDLGETVVFGGHKIGATADGLTWTTTDFTALCDYVKAYVDAGLADAVPLEVWFDGLTPDASIWTTVASNDDTWSAAAAAGGSWSTVAAAANTWA